MKNSFFQKLLTRVDQLSAEELHAHFLHLARDKGFFETIFNTLQEGVVVLTQKGQIEYYNQSAKRLLSLPDDQVSGEHIQRYLKGLDWESFLQTGQSTSRVIEIHYPEHLWLEFYLVPVESQQEGGPTFAAIFYDVTQKRFNEKETIESERIHAITLLAAGVAHELGNPINNLNIHLQLMERDIRDLPREKAARLRESISIAHKEIKRLDSIIGQFLRAIRPSAPNLASESVTPVIMETLDLLDFEIKDRDILVETEFPSFVPNVMMDAEQLKQAFYNIIRNALHAMNEGGILRISVEQKEKDLAISFIDNGSGISADNLPHILQPYYTTKQKGHGLGLMIVQRIIREHGGEIEIESEENKGTTLKVKLPLEKPRVHMLEDAKK